MRIERIGILVATCSILACGDPEVTTVVVDTAGTSTASGTGGTGGDTSGTTTTSDTPGTDDTGTSSGTGAGTGSTASTGGTGSGSHAPKCGEELTGKPIGAPCTDHADCETGYCYDEALWNEDLSTEEFRFCTAACVGCTLKGNCNEWGKAPSINENKCNPFPTYFVQRYGLKYDSLCLASCGTDNDCAGLAPFTTCKRLAFGKDLDYGVVKICQPESFPKLPDDEF